MRCAANSTPVMSPAVFCASLEPWARLNAAADNSCSFRKYLSIFDGVDLRNSQYTMIIRVYADTMPISGAPMIILRVKGQSPLALRLSASIQWSHPRIRVTWAIAAPEYPPISACDELVGSPSHHVMRSQTIAPDSPARITYGVTRPMLTKPVMTVLATWVLKKKPATKLKNAAHRTA